ncbi:2-dehydro-3-deoxygluconokinase [Mesobacillus campisalis]|uniref:2-dehydro-3-deoxygluconokinase n=1 Tax=Mesobacillus campisalis TaxID=1408103 RepID=A0A0M2SH26_9BACI|nr:sugar kinase [Mesobacillus campisalis]KKK33598.1 2-dehydro-3-deoxygluconokinase [Mesobacillus campisalis]
MKKVITFGEILLRLSTSVGERLSQAGQIKMHYGGAEANVGISLARFGHEVSFVSKVPDNPLGLAVEGHLRAHGVSTQFLLKGGERLGTYYLESGVGPRSAQVTYDRKYSSISQLAIDELDFDAIFKQADLFHVTGITAALAPPMKEVVLHSLKKAKEHGVSTSFDFNYRAKLWSHEEAGDAFKAFLPYVDICSCGELDALSFLGIEKADVSLTKAEKLEYYYGKISEMYPNIQTMYSTFREVVSASTNTLQGNFYTNGKLHQSRVFQIDHIVDRVGGGDAFAAGVLHGILEGTAPDELITFATAASVLKHSIHGDCNLFSPEEIDTFASSTPGKIVR